MKYFEGRDGAISAHEEFYEMHSKEAREGCFIYNKDLLDQTFTQEEQDRYRDIRVGKLVTPLSVYTHENGDIEFKTPGTECELTVKSTLYDLTSS